MSAAVKRETPRSRRLMKKVAFLNQPARGLANSRLHITQIINIPLFRPLVAARPPR